MRTRWLVGGVVCLLGTFGVAAQQARPDWQQQVRELIARKELPAALAVTEKRLAEAPQDLEARGWRARLFAWTNHLPEAEADYRRVLESTPRDTDVLSGLAVVLAREQRFEEALSVLTLAKSLDPQRTDVLLQRARVLRALGRNAEGRADFAAAAALEPGNAEARAGVASLRPEPRHQVRIGNDTDFFNYTDPAAAQAVILSSRWTQQWSTSFAASSWERFGERAGKFTGSATHRFGRNTGLTVGGAFANEQPVIPRSEAFFELDRAFQLSERKPVRGLEAVYDQHWFWYERAHILTLSPTLLFYLPQDWTVTLSGTAARSRFAGTGAEWRPSGVVKLGFPVVPRLTGSVSFAVGTENFARADQVGSFSARTYGGGLRFQITPRQDVTVSVSYQNRTQGRTQTSFGLSYGLRF